MYKKEIKQNKVVSVALTQGFMISTQWFLLKFIYLSPTLLYTIYIVNVLLRYLCDKRMINEE